MEDYTTVPVYGQFFFVRKIHIFSCCCICKVALLILGSATFLKVMLGRKDFMKASSLSRNWVAKVFQRVL